MELFNLKKGSEKSRETVPLILECIRCNIPMRLNKCPKLGPASRRRMYLMLCDNSQDSIKKIIGMCLVSSALELQRPKR
jgi:hypothetical protein